MFVWQVRFWGREGTRCVGSRLSMAVIDLSAVWRRGSCGSLIVRLNRFYLYFIDEFHFILNHEYMFG